MKGARFSLSDGTSLGVGSPEEWAFLHRKSYLLYHDQGNESRVLAYFRSEECAQVALDWLTKLARLSGWKERA